MTEPKGAIFLWPDEPHVTGYLVVAGISYELVGVRTSKTRTDFTGRRTTAPTEKQMDIFDDAGSGDGNG